MVPSWWPPAFGCLLALVLVGAGCAGPTYGADHRGGAKTGAKGGEGADGAASGPTELGLIYGSGTNDGLRFEDLQEGLGPSIQMGDRAKVHYVGRLEDGREFDSSRNRPGAFEFELGKGMVIKGFERGMVGMKVGGVRRIHIPWALAYGAAGSPPRIPPKANLVFEIELLDIPVPEVKTKPPRPGPGGAPSQPMR